LFHSCSACRSARVPLWRRSSNAGFIQAKSEREACYQRQAAALAARRKPEPTFDTRPMETLRQMRRDDDDVYRSLRSICRGC
jgi:hypothetical protein